jgi:hypothetical protein
VTVTEVIFAVEGYVDVAVAEKLIRLSGRVPRPGPRPGGKTAIDRNLTRWNQQSNRQPFLILRDWDEDDAVVCIPSLLDRLKIDVIVAPSLVFRIPVRSTESWLMADFEAFARYFRIGKHSVPVDVDDLVNPKRTAVDLCRTSPKSIRDGMLPREGSGRSVGAEYASFMADFGQNHWDPVRAATRSPSLQRAIKCIRRMVDEGRW